MTTPDTTVTFRVTEQDALDASRLVSYRMLNGSYFYLLTAIFTPVLCVLAFANGGIRGVILVGTRCPNPLSRAQALENFRAPLGSAGVPKRL